MRKYNPCQAYKFVLAEATFILLLVVDLVPTISFAFNYDGASIFLQCLDNHSTHQNPTSEVTYTQHNSSYPSVFNEYVQNARFLQPTIRKPLVIVTPRNEHDIRATILCCKSHGLQMRIRGGGHDMEGISYTASVPFVILDMFNLCNVDININEETAWVQGGAVLGEVYYNIAQKSSVLGFPGGVCPTVGTSGHFSGGGYGNMMRQYGLATDNILDAWLMDANGKVIDRKEMGEDLFWAIRGGGAASFGVILAWKIKLVRVPPTVTVFKVNRSLEEGVSQMVYRWQEVAPDLPKTLYLRVRVSVIKDEENNSNKLQFYFIAMYLGQSDALIKLLANRFPELKLSSEECLEMPWVNSTLFWYGFPIGTPTQVLVSRKYEKISRKVKSDFVTEPIPQAGLEQIWKQLLDMDGLVMEWNPYGGRMNEIPSNATAFPYRAGYLFKIEYDFIWHEQKTEVDKYHLYLSRELHRFMTPYVSMSPRKAFFNYRDLDIGINIGRHAPNNQTAFWMSYFGDNFHRLVKVKTETDPANFFRNEQSIPPITLL